MFSHSEVLNVFADCGTTEIDGDGASCSNSGSIPGTDENNGSGEDDQTDDNNDDTDSNNDDNGEGDDSASCTAGTAGSVNLYGTVESSEIASNAGDFDIDGLVFQLPDGTYFYIIDKRNGSKPITGYLELVR